MNFFLGSKYFDPGCCQSNEILGCSPDSTCNKISEPGIVQVYEMDRGVTTITLML